MKPRHVVKNFRQACSLTRLFPAALLFISPVAQAAPTCGESPTHEAFNVQGLKSELMVTALSCSAQDRYNAFVTKFRPKLAEEEGRLDRYFRSNYGRAASRQRDDYVTQLANVQSKGGVQAGTVFCAQRMQMFDEIDALKDGADLSHYAEGKDIAQPESFESCSGPRNTTARAQQHRRRRGAKH